MLYLRVVPTLLSYTDNDVLNTLWSLRDVFFPVMKTRSLYSNLKRRIVINLLIFLEITLLNLVLYKNHAASCFGSFGSKGVIVATLIIFRRDEI